jgi:hypothetical protein
MIPWIFGIQSKYTNHWTVTFGGMSHVLFIVLCCFIYFYLNYTVWAACVYKVKKLKMQGDFNFEGSSRGIYSGRSAMSESLWMEWSKQRKASFRSAGSREEGWHQPRTWACWFWGGFINCAVDCRHRDRCWRR